MERYISTKSIFGAAVEAARRPGSQFQLIPHSTLNEYFNILSSATLPDDANPEVKYLAIGRGGHGMVTGGDGEAVMDIKQHRCNNARLFTHLPFVLRTVDNDLSATERQKYAMRVLKQYNGTNYFAYFLMRLTLSTTTPTVTKLTASNGVTTSSAYTQTAADLTNPQPVSTTNGVINSASNESLSVTSPWPVTLTADDISEIVSACEIIYSDSRYAELSEIGIVSGIDFSTTSTAGGVSVTYDEVIAAQIYTFIGTYVNLLYQTSTLSMGFNIGSTIPYLT